MSNAKQHEPGRAQEAGMTDKQVQSKLNRIAKLCNELDAEAKRRYGEKGNLYFSDEGYFHLMKGEQHDELSVWHSVQRQDRITFSSVGYCRLGAGSW